MGNTASKVALRIVLAVSLLAATSLLANAAEEQADQKAIALFEQGVASYEAGQSEKAKSAFEELLALQPSSSAAQEISKKPRYEVLFKMRADDRLAPTAEKMLQFVTAAARESKRQIADVEKLLTDFQSPDLATHLKARFVLIGHGPYAVPYLLQFLTRQGPQNQVIVARTISTIKNMGRDACPPLMAALATKDAVLKTRVASVLGQIRDARALPPLLALYQDGSAPQPVRDSASEAIKNIAGKDAATFGPAIREYEKLVESYLKEDATAVGYVFGEWAEVWKWNEAPEKLQDKLSCELAPNFLYYQRQGAEYALQALSLNPENLSLKSSLVALLCRQLRLVKTLAPEASKDVKKDAEARLAALEKQVPLICHLYDADVIGMSLKRAQALQDSWVSLYLTEILGSKAGPDAGVAAQALGEGLGAPDRDARYRASVEMVRLSPTGAIGEPEKVMQVLSAALKRAASKNALLVFNDLQERNRLRTALGKLEMQGVECDAVPGAIDEILRLEPAVDVVFVTGNVPDAVFRTLFNKLKSDIRTAALPTYVMIDATQQAADVSKYEGLSGVLSPDDIRAAKLGPIVQPILSRRTSALAQEQGDIVLQAAEALRNVDPKTTKYPLGLLEPSLIGALRGYGEPVSMAVVADLKSFGSAKSLGPLSQVAADKDNSPELKARACYAIASVLKRTQAKPPAEVVEVLKASLKSDNKSVREAAAEALGVAGLSGMDLLEIVETQIVTSK
jgi:HEAT repeat protein